MRKVINTIVGKVMDISESLFFETKLKSFYGEAKKSFSAKPVVFDVGGHTGESISLFSEIVPSATIHSFEPNPRLYDIITQKFAGKKNVVVNKLGVSSIVGTKTFYENTFDVSSSFSELNQESGYLKKKATLLGIAPEKLISNQYDVQVTTLDHYIQQNKIQHIDILKVDVEGHEFDVLQGLTKSFTNPDIAIGYIQLEHHYHDMYKNGHSFEEIAELLKQYSYTPAGRIKHSFGNFYEMIFSKTAL